MRSGHTLAEREQTLQYWRDKLPGVDDALLVRLSNLLVHFAHIDIDANDVITHLAHPGKKSMYSAQCADDELSDSACPVLEPLAEAHHSHAEKITSVLTVMVVSGKSQIYRKGRQLRNVMAFLKRTFPNASFGVWLAVDEDRETDILIEVHTTEGEPPLGMTDHMWPVELPPNELPKFLREEVG